MLLDEHKALARRFGQVWSPGGQAIVDELAAPDLTVFYPALQEPLRGPEAFKQFLGAFYTAFPDAQVTISELIAEGDTVVSRWMVHGTHQGEFRGIPPTGKTVAWTGITILRIKDGKIVEESGEGDALGLLQQLGVLPTPGQAEEQGR